MSYPNGVESKGGTVTGIEFKVGYNDHHKVEEFLASGPAGVAAVRLDARFLRRQAEVVDAARRAGVC